MGDREVARELVESSVLPHASHGELVAKLAQWDNRDAQRSRTTRRAR